MLDEQQQGEEETMAMDPIAAEVETLRAEVIRQGIWTNDDTEEETLDEFLEDYDLPTRSWLLHGLLED